MQNKYYAVIDTETAYDSTVISIGAAVIDKHFNLIDTYYCVIDDRHRYPGMYTGMLYARKINFEGDHFGCISNMRQFLKLYDIDTLFAYNAKFDLDHLAEFNGFTWIDIMKTAAYKNHNPLIKPNRECAKSGRLKSGYGVEALLREFTKSNYHETHNAVQDAIDEAKLMRVIGVPIENYMHGTIHVPTASAKPVMKFSSKPVTPTTPAPAVPSPAPVIAGLPSDIASVLSQVSNNAPATPHENKQINVTLSDEQQDFIDKALAGNNILVDACIGSGKTTAIQKLCSLFPANKNILYLTYNRLLKTDAQDKIRMPNVLVQNYHGFAAKFLFKNGHSAGVSDLITAFNNIHPEIPRYDVLIIDEYQDIESEFALMLDYIKTKCQNIQIIAVGDMDQKIYDKTNLNVKAYIRTLLGDDFLRLEFTKCFRLPAQHAARLGKLWNKTITGVNNNCSITIMKPSQAMTRLSQCDPGDILCLGSRTGMLSDTLNMLETIYPYKFNKNTVYASISDDDKSASIRPDDSTAIFTTFDSSKGMERPVCVVFDFTEVYWASRVNKPMQDSIILKNIFLVAASRGKSEIIFVHDNDHAPLSDATLMRYVRKSVKFNTMAISTMFDFKYHEDINYCYGLLKTNKITDMASYDRSEIKINHADGLIDLAPCIGIYQEAMYFDKYDIDKDIRLFMKTNRDKASYITDDIFDKPVDEKILILTSLQTSQNRYATQVTVPFVNNIAKQLLTNRLATRLKPDDNSQTKCSIQFGNPDGSLSFTAEGYSDVIVGDTVYELKFVAELSHEHFLQCACYMMALGLNKGILWNTRFNDAYEISIPDKNKFIDAVARCVTKGVLDRHYNVY